MPIFDAAPRPAYLDAATVKQGLLTYHADRARHYRECLTDQMVAEADFQKGAGFQFSPADFERRVAEASWREGSIVAVWRDNMRFHERCVEFLTNA